MTSTTQPITAQPSGTATPQALRDAMAAVTAINMRRNLEGDGFRRPQGRQAHRPYEP